jgi:hypothetical protein
MATAIESSEGFNAAADWRVRMSLGETANYLYKSPGTPGILLPLRATDGVIFPYTPVINVTYAATYDSITPTHSNYKLHHYQSSSVDNFTITAEFTAQDTFEANYVLACIHFFKSMTKMFYGQDENPKIGTPPPLAFLHGMGAFQFNKHPLVISNFAYALPKDVDYIRATNTETDSDGAGVQLIGGQLEPGGVRPIATFVDTGDQAITYVPTKITLTITCFPVVSRNDISNEFSLRDYASGKLLRGSQRQGGGIW